MLPNKSIITIASVALLYGLLSATTNGFAETAPDIPQGIFGYQERVGDTTIPFDWQAEKKKDGVVIHVIEDGKTFYNYCDDQGATVEWRIEVENKHDITVVRKGDTLHIDGIRFGKEYSKTVEIDDRPWYQPLSYSLGAFLNSAQKKTSFWVVRADKIEVLPLTAKKIGQETLTVGNEQVETQMVEIRAEGFYSQFWSATYWYRKSDNLFLRYQSIHGLPGTDETIVELVESPPGYSDS